MKLNVVLGQDLSAYAEIEIDVPEGAPEAEIVEAVLKSDPYDDVVFDPDWESVSSMRIVSARDEEGNYLVQDYPLEPIPFDAGQALASWLKGWSKDLSGVIDAAAQAKLIDRPVMEVYRGTFKLPGAELIEVEFECRKGATREEKDLAFFEALAQIGTADYVAIGDLPACSTCEHDPGTCKDAGVCAISRKEV